MKQSPLVLEIKGNSLDDGPGIRTVVFLKGCPLDCLWCHNPESKKRSAELSFNASRCIGCGTCREVCAPHALSGKKITVIDRERCTECLACAGVCPSGALEKTGREVEIDEIVSTVLKDKAFFDNSGGGVTLSGGEPTLNIEFTSRLMKALKDEGVHILIETCGLFDFESFREMILPYGDIIFYDIKIFNKEEHIKYCGVSNEKILQNFINLNRLCIERGVEIVPRTPLVPGITDTEDNLSAIAHFYRNHGITRAELLSYNPLWPEKMEKLGRENPFAGGGKMTRWLAQDNEKACEKIFTDMGICLHNYK